MTAETERPERPYRKDHDSATRTRIEVVERMARYDESDRAVCFPRKDRPDRIAEALLREHADEKAAPHTESCGMSVYSFDIDLTIAMPEDTEGCAGPIPIQRLIDLQQQGHVVGTCSDREPSDQREAIRQAGLIPDFSIPKELLKHLGEMLPGARMQHVGDDAERDRRIALQSGWEHRWPADECP